MPLFAAATSSCTRTRLPSVTAIPSTVSTPGRTAVRVAPTPDAPLLYVLAGRAVVVASCTLGLTASPCTAAFTAAATNASVAICVLVSPGAAVGAAGTPVKVGLATGANADAGWNAADPN